MTQLELNPKQLRIGAQATAAKPAVEHRPVSVDRGPAAILAAACWFGLVAGILETVVLLVNRELLRRVVLDWLRLNRHALWMVPAADLGLLLLIGLAFAAAAHWLGRRAFPAALASMAFLTVLAPLFAVHRLHPLACILLAAGVSARFAGINEVRSRRLRRVVRRSVPALALLTAVWCGYQYLRVAGAEQRAIAALPLTAPDAPNVVLIALDTVRADHLSAYGYHRATSPRLEALARAGVQFERAVSPSNWTLPAHACLFSGRWHWQVTASADRRLDGKYPVLAEFLRDHGYATGGFVANTINCNSAYDFDRGFTHYEDFPERTRVSFVELLNASELCRRTLQVAGLADALGLNPYGVRKEAPEVTRAFLSWAERQQGRPFFAFLNYFDAHDPFILPDGVSPRYGPAARTPAQEHVLRDWSHPNRGALPPEQASLVRDAYDDGIAYLDDQIGRLLDEMRARGLAENTVIVITADHGECLGEHDLYSHGRSLYQPEVHVPLMIVAPRSVPTGRRITAAVTTRDVPATVADLVGLGAASPFPGHSLARYWHDERSGRFGDGPVLSEVFIRTTQAGPASLAPALKGPIRAVVLGDYKYIWYGDGTEELFNLTDDPAETRNQAASTDLRAYREILRVASRRNSSLPRATEHSPGAPVSRAADPVTVAGPGPVANNADSSP